jgi:tetratricopeptide (TPR) repeat protein
MVHSWHRRRRWNPGQSLGDSRRARNYFERALAVAEQTSTPRIQDFLRANFAGTLVHEGDYQKATDILEGVVARGVDRYPPVRVRELADTYLKLSRLDAAMGWAQKAVEVCGNRESLDCIRALDVRAGVHAALGNDEAALADLRAAMTAIEAVRSRLVPVDFFKQQFQLAQEDLYSRAIALQVRRGRSAEALETAELARSRAFVDLLASRDLRVATGGESPHGGKSAALPAPLDTSPLVFRGAPDNRSASVSVPARDLLSAVSVGRRRFAGSSSLLYPRAACRRLRMRVRSCQGLRRARR